MEVPITKSVSSAEAAALWTPTFLADAGTLFGFGLRQIVGMANTFGRVGNVGSGT